MGNTFGQLFRLTTFGESHGAGLGAIIDGCPAGLKIDIKDIQDELDRRKPGQSEITTARAESDQVEIMSGIKDGVTLGTSIGLIIRNQDAKSKSYNNLEDLFRPSHADYTYEARYGLRDHRGGGRASNRETAARVAAGAIAKKLIEELTGAKTLAWVEQIFDVTSGLKRDEVTLEQVEANIVRCPDPSQAEKMIKLVKEAKSQGNSLGGIITFRVNSIPAGLMSIPATRSIGFGLGSESIYLRGSEHNDPMILKDGKVATPENKAGGILGGISTGESIYGHLSFKPIATLFIEQHT